MPTWNPKLAVGVPAIDRQHQELFARIDALLDAMSQGKAGPELVKLVAFLEDYCIRHFASEATLMASKAYPDRAAHLAEHALFTSQFKEISKEIAAKGSNSALAIKTQQLLKDWLIRHIGSVDVKMARFVGADAQMEI